MTEQPVINSVPEQKLNTLIQRVNRVVLEEATTGAEYLSLLHILLTKALSNLPRGMEKAMIKKILHDSKKLRIENKKEKQNAR